MMKRFGHFAAAITLSVVPLSACDAASQKLSTADACGDLVQMSLSELRDAQENLDNPASVEKGLRDAAQDFRDKASQIDDAEVRDAAEGYAATVKKLADKAASGQTPDLDAVARANEVLAGACG